MSEPDHWQIQEVSFLRRKVVRLEERQKLLLTSHFFREREAEHFEECALCSNPETCLYCEEGTQLSREATEAFEAVSDHLREEGAPELPEAAGGQVLAFPLQS